VANLARAGRFGAAIGTPLIGRQNADELRPCRGTGGQKRKLFPRTEEAKPGYRSMNTSLETDRSILQYYSIRQVVFRVQFCTEPKAVNLFCRTPAIAANSSLVSTIVGVC